jgi:hypothetical protein
LTFGSQLLAGDENGVTDQFAFLLSGQHDPATMTDHFSMVLWDMNKQQTTSLTSVFQQFSHITAWSTNSEVDRGGYFYAGLARGFTSEDKARGWGSPKQAGIADLTIKPPSGSWTSYQLYTDWNDRLWEWVPLVGKPSSFYEALSLTVDAANFVADVTDLQWIDGRYPVIYRGSPILGSRNLSFEIDRPVP